MKQCQKCLLTKDLVSFNKYKDGFQAWCKACLKEYRVSRKDQLSKYFSDRYEQKKRQILDRNRKWKDANKSKIRDFNAQYYTENKEAILAWEKKNREKSRENSRKRYKRDKRKIIAKNLARHKRVRTATPVWLSDFQKKEIRRFYENCPIGYHVDHMVPIKGKNVCGLHVLWNLQYLTKAENIAKGNR